MDKKKQFEAILALKSLIMMKFGDELGDTKAEQAKLVNKDVYKGEDDPGGWAPEALAVIHCESGIPSGYYNEVDTEKWFEIDNELQARGFHVHHEDINAAVKAYYED